MSDSIRIRRALLSVSDKTGLVDFAKALHDSGVEILSTGGTAKALMAEGVPITEVSAHTGFPEIMGGRVKTLHPKIHGGILGRRGVDDSVMAEHRIEPIDLVAVNLYPFEQTIARDDCDRVMAIENIDIGGPAMVRAAAKNHADVTVVVDPEDYPAVAAEVAEGVSSPRRQQLAAKAFSHTAAYDAAISQYLNFDQGIDLPGELAFAYQKRMDLRYGENPHQQAAFYVSNHAPSGTLASSSVLQGKALSFNNINDAEAALSCVKAFASAPACVIVKHANPCGVAVAASLSEAYERAFATDPTSAFGGIIAVNRPLDVTTASAIIERQFAEVILAPAVESAAAGVLSAKPNIRVLSVGEWFAGSAAHDLKPVSGGLLVQTSDNRLVDREELKVVTEKAPSEAQLDDLLFAWRVAKYVKSNAIVYAKAGQTIGVGAGQMSRVVSAKIAAMKAADAGLEVTGAVMASDAFFPFRDGIDSAAGVGIKAVVQPGGSMRDEEVIAAANEHGIAMVFTGVRHFKH